MKARRKIIQINEYLCDGCGKCTEACSEGAIIIMDGKARLVDEKYCDGLGACIGECPNGAIKIHETEAEEFDAEAVEEYLNKASSINNTLSEDNESYPKQTPSTKKGDKKSSVEVLPCGCPSTQIEALLDSQDIRGKKGLPTTISYLNNWPIQIRLIPAKAPFLKGARLLIASDCSTAALPNLHEEFLKDRTLMMGCPKFDDTATYIQKFAEIFKENEIKEVTAIVMEVPCCQGLPVIVKKGIALAKKHIRVEKLVITPAGKIKK